MAWSVQRKTKAKQLHYMVQKEGDSLDFPKLLWL